MNEVQTYSIRAAGVQGFLGVAFGAFGAHGLPALLAKLPPEELARRLGFVATGSRYQLVHAAALLALAALSEGTLRGRALARPARCFFCGPLLFGATLYALALGAPSWLGAVTPVGGLLMLAGWALLALGPKAVPIR